MKRWQKWMVAGGLLGTVGLVVTSVDIAPHVEYVPDQLAGSDSIPAPPSAYGAWVPLRRMPPTVMVNGELVNPL